MAQLNDGRVEILSRDDGSFLSQATAGRSQTVLLNQPSVVKIHGTREMVAEFERQGNDLILHMRDGSVVRYQQFFLDDVDGDHSELVFDDGINPPQHALFPVTSEMTNAQTAMAITPEYESLSSVEPLLLADTGASNGVVTAAGIGALGLAGLVVGAAAGGGGGGGDNGGGGGETPTPTPGTPTVAINAFTGDAVLTAAEKASNQTLSGTTTNAEAGSVVTVVLNGKTYTTTVGANGSWNVTIPAADLAALPTGNNTISVSVTNGSGNTVTSTENIAVQASPVTPGTPTITINDFAGDNVLDGAERQTPQTHSGRTTNVEQGQTVTLTFGDQTMTATVGANGTWSVSVPPATLQALAAGTVTLVATVSNAAGTAVSANKTVTVINGASISISEPAGDGYLNATEAQAAGGLTLSGFSTEIPAGTPITITLNGKAYTTTVGENGGWTVNVPTGDLQLLPQGANLIVATATVNGTLVQNSSAVSLNVDTSLPNATVDVPFGDGILSGSEAATAQTLTGNTGSQGAGQTVIVTVNGIAFPATVNPDGSWSVSIPATTLQGLPQNSNDISVEVTDAAGNSATGVTPVTVVTTPPSLTVNLPDGPLNQADLGQPLLLTGQSPGSQTVTVTLNDITYTATVNPNGSWQISVPASDLGALQDGTVPLTVTTTDAYGNTASQPAELTVDATPPTVSVNPISGDGYVNAGELAQELSVSGQTQPGTRITVQLDGVDINATVDPVTGIWTAIIPETSKEQIADGSYPVTVIATDEAGNRTETYTSITILADAQPSLTVDPLTADNILNGAELAVAQALTGTSEDVQAGQTVTVTIQGVGTYTGVVQAGGGWRVDIPADVLNNLANGTYDYSINVSDIAGNAAPAVNGNFDVAVDNSVPTLSIGPVSTDDAISAQEAAQPLTLSGSSAGLAASTPLTVTLNGVDYATTVQADGTWSIVVPPAALTGLGNGNYTIEVTGQDGASNPVTDIREITVRTSFPNNIEVGAAFGDNILNGTESTTPQTLSGNSGVTFSDQIVTVTLNGVDYPATVDATTGNWTLTLLPGVLNGLPEGATDITVTVSDALGNSVSTTSPITVDKTSPALTVDAVGDDGVINSVNQNQPLTLSGTAEQGSTLTVVLNGVTYRTGTDSSGNWTLNIAPSTLQTLPDGKVDIRVTATDAGGNQTTTLAPVTVDKTAPEVSLNPVSGDGYLNAVEHNALLALTGSAEAGSTVVVTLNGVDYTATVAANGSWRAEVPANVVSALPDGNYTVSVQATDSAGNSATTTQPLVVIASAADLPTVSVAPFTGDNILDGAEKGLSQFVTGTTSNVQAGQVVTVTFNGQQYSGQIQADGSWSVLVPAAAFYQLANGAQSYVVNVTDVAGNPATATGNYTVDNTFSAIAIGVISDDNMINAVEAQNDMVIHGFSRFVQFGARILVRFNNVDYETTANSDGSWNVTVPANALGELPNGNILVTATTTDVNGNEIFTTQNLNAEVNPDFNVTINPPFTDGTLNGAESLTDQQLTGTTGVTGTGQTVTVVLAGITYTGTVDADGNWSVTLPAAVLQGLPQGENAYSVTLTDPAGNITGQNTSFVKDTVVPVVSLDVISDDNRLGINDQTEALTLSGSGEQGDLITVVFNGVTYTAEVTGTGNWSVEIPQTALTGLTDGSYPVQVTSSDAAGNTTTLTRTVDVDLTPSAVSVNVPSEDGYINATEARQPLVINGTGETGDTVTVELNDVTYTAVVDGNGQWTLTIPGAVINALPNGDYVVNVTASDAAGNTTLTSTPLVVDKLAPSIFVADITANNIIDGAEQQAAQLITGTANNVEAGQTLTVTLNNVTYTTTVEAGGTWQVSVPSADLLALANGTQTLTVTTTDIAGNAGTTDKTFTVNNALSGIAFDPLSEDGYLNALEAQEPLIVTGFTANVPEGTTVTFTLNGVDYVTEVDGDGNWSVTVPSVDLLALPEGAQNGTASVTVDGNTITSNASLNVYVDRVPEPTLSTPFTDGVLTNAEAGVAQTLTGTTGTTGDGQSVTITIGGVDYPATVNSSGVWTLALSPAILQALPQGESTLNVTVRDIAGNSADITPAPTINVATNLPEFTLAPLAGGDGIINDIEQGNPLEVTGTVTPGSSVTLTLNGVQYQADVDGDGNWTATIPAADLGDLPDGNYGLQLSVSDAVGNTVTQTSPLAVDTAAPAFTLDPVAGDDIIDRTEAAQPLAITGTGSEGDSVEVAIGGQTYTVVVDADGNWRVSVPASTLANLAEGDNTVTVTVTSPAGNTATSDRTVTVDTSVDNALIVNTVAGDDIINAAEAAAGFTVTGSVPAATTTVVVEFNGNSYTATVGANGLWSATIPATALAGVDNGEYTLNVTATPATGAPVTVPHTVTLDTLAPVFGVGTLAEDGFLNTLEQGQPLTINGTGTEGDNVRVTLNGQVYLATVQGDGTWSVEVPQGNVAALTNGNYPVTVVVTDAAGNSATQSSNLAVDLTPPALAITSVGGDGVLNVADQGQPLTLSGTGEAGAELVVTFNGVNYPATVQPNGQWTLDVPVEALADLTNGDYTVSVTATDAAGNTATQESTLSVVVDPATLPTLALDPFAGNDVLDGAEQQVNQLLTGQTENVPAGQFVTVTLNDVVYTGVVLASGAWSVTIPAAALAGFADGTNVAYSVTVADAAGNPVTQTGAFAVNTALSAIAINPISGDGYLSAAEAGQGLTVSGSSANVPEGSTLTVTVGDVTYDAEVGAGGAWTVTVPSTDLLALPEGELTVSVSGIDGAGNPVTSESPLFVAITTLPVITTEPPFTDGTLNAAESAQPQALTGATGLTGDGQTVSVVINGTTYTGTVDGAGNWSIPLPQALLQSLSEGDTPAVVTIADAAGNTDSETLTLTVDRTPPEVTVAQAAGDGILNAAEQGQALTLSGTSEGLATVVVTLNGVDYTATVDGDGNWEAIVPAEDLQALGDQSYTVIVTATDVAGNSSSTTTSLVVKAGADVQPTVTVNAFAGNDILDGAEQQATQTLSGTTTNVEAGQTVTITLGQQVYTATVQASGAWSVNVPAAALGGLDDGTATFTVAVNDIAGNPATTTHDFTVNSAASGITIDLLSDDGFLNFNEAQDDLIVTGVTANVAAGETVTLTFNGQTFTAEVGSGGVWSAVIPAASLAGLPDGAATLTASVTDGTGATITSNSTLTVRVNALPLVVADTPFTNGVLNGNEAAVTQILSGRTGVTGDGQGVSVVIDGTTYTGTVDASGNWQISLPATALQSLDQGANALPVTATDAAGNSNTLNVPVSVDTVAPTLTLNAIAGDGVVNTGEAAAEITVSGSSTGAEVGQIVTVSILGQNYTTAIDADGNWSLQLPAGLLADAPDGSYPISVTLSDAAGNSTSATDDLTISTLTLQPTLNPPFGDGFLNQLESQNPQTLTGSTGIAGAGQTVTVTLDGVDYPADVDASGAWSLTIGSDVLAGLGEGAQTIIVNAADAQGNTGSFSSTITVDLTLPTLTLTPVATDNIINAAEILQPVSITGSASVTEAGQLVTVTFNGQTWQQAVQDDGTWRIDLPSNVTQALTDGDYPVSVTLTDRAGNSVTQGLTVTVNASPANLPTITVSPVSGDDYVNATEVAGDLTISGTTTNVAEGQTVTITFNDVSYQATVGAGGVWSTTVPSTALTGLDDGAYSIGASVADTAGNPAVTTHEITLLAQTASLPVITLDPITNDDVINFPESRGDVEITGTSQRIPAGQTITVTIDGVDYPATVDPDGNWSATVPASAVQGLDQGTHTVTASGQDVAGNPATVSENFTVDTTPPLLTLTLGAGADGILNQAEALAGLVINGTTDANLTVTVTLNGKAYTATADGAGIWSLTVPGGDLLKLPGDSVDVSVTVTDASGNVSDETVNLGLAINVLPALTLDTPFVDSILNAAEVAAEQTLTGTATNLAEGTEVQVTIGGNVFIGEVGPGNLWSVTIPAGGLATLPDGAAEIVVTAVDAAGNPASASDAVELLTTLPVVTIAQPFIDGALNAAEAGVNQVISGSTGITGEGQIVRLNIDGNPVTATVDARGNWSATLTPQLSATLGNGDHTITVEVEDRAGNIDSETLDYTAIITGLPAPTLDLPFTDGILNAAEALQDGELTGSTGITGPQSVTVNINGVVYPADVNSDGNWSLGLASAVLTTLPDGVWPITVTATDSVGNAVSVNGALTVAINDLPNVSINLPFGDGQLNVQEAGLGQVISGSTGKAGVGQTVTVTLDGGQALTATVDANGNWSLALTPEQLSLANLGNGTHTLLVTARDSAGNSDTETQTFDAYLALPNPVINPPFGDTVLNINEANGAITLTGNTGATGPNQGARLSIDVGGTIYNGTVDANGNWTVSLPAGALNGLTNGAHTLNVTVTDPAGNSVTETVDFTAALTPPVATLATPFTDAILNLAEAAAGADLTGSTGIAADQVGSVVVTVGNQNYPATVNANGTWTLNVGSEVLQALPQTTQNISVVVTDINGNTSTVGGSFQVDLTPPTITVGALTGDGTLTYLESLTTQTLSGTTDAPAGQTVTVTIGSATLTGVVQANGTWSVNLTPSAMAQLGANGETGTITVSVNDVAGNPGTATTNVVLNLTPPETPILTLSPVGGDNIINSNDDGTVTVTGSFANLPELAGVVSGTVTLSVNGVAVGTYVVTTTDGTWSVTIPDPLAVLPDGTQNLTAELTTNAGTTLNTAGTVLVDRTVPAVTINAFATDDILNASEAGSAQTLSGTASVSEAGRAVTITLGDKTYSAIVQGDGTWSVSVPSGDLQALGQAGQTIEATLTDAAGNVGEATRPVTVDTGAPLIEVDALLGDNLINAADILTTKLVTGRASGAEGQTIGLYLGDSSPIATAVVNQDGTFSLSLSPEVLGNLTDGTLVFGLRVNDASGNQTDATLTVNKVVNSALNFVVDSLNIFGDGFLNAADTAVAQTITGLVASPGVGATVSLTVGGTTTTANVGQDGRFALVVPPSVLGLLQPGETSLNLVLTDSAGNTRTLGQTVNTILDAPVINDLTNLLGVDNILSIVEAATAQTVGGTIDAVAGSLVTVTLGTRSYQTQVQAGGAWNLTIPPLDLQALTSGPLQLGIRVVDPAGNSTSTSVGVNILTAQPTITLSPLFGDGILNAADAALGQTLSGVVNNVAAGTVVNLNVGGTTLQATVGQNGAFSAALTPALLQGLQDGTLTVGASVTDAAGNQANAGLNATVKLTLPTVSISPLFGDGLLNVADALAGQLLGGVVNGAGAGSRVTVAIGNTQLTTTTDANGAYSLALTPAILQTLADGNLTVRVSVTDSAGNTNSATAGAVVGLHNLPTINLNPLFGDGVLNLLESLVTQTLSGTTTAAVGSTISLNVGGTPLTTTVQPGGVFSIGLLPSLLSTLLDGNITVGASVRDNVGNTVSTSTGVKVGISTTPTLTLNTIFGDGVLSASDLNTAQTISGTTSGIAAGTAVTVTLNAKTYTTTVGSNGGWNLSVPKADLAALNGTNFTVNATVSDAYGNVASGNGPLSVIARVAPTVTINSIFGDGLLSAVDALSAQTISGTSTNAEGSTIRVQVGGASLTATVGANGTWSVLVPPATLAALPDGTDTITATLTNAAGNAGTGSATVLVGTHTLPTVAITNSTMFGGDRYLNLSEANAPEVISGTSTNAVGSTVSVNVAGNIYTTTVGANGSWSVTVPSAALRNIPDGSANVTVTLTDAVGNTSTASNGFTAITHNLPAIGVDPVLSLLNVLLTGLTVSGSTRFLAQGSHVNVTLGGVTQQATIDALGRFSTKFTGGLLTALSLNSIVTVTAVDAAGNPASTSTTLLLGSLLPVTTSSVAAASVLMAVAADDATAVASTASHRTSNNEESTATAHATAVDSTLVTGSDTAATDSAAAATTETPMVTPESAEALPAEEGAYTIGGVVITLASGETVEGASVTGSSGNDTVTVNSLDFNHIDGGAGTDTLVLNGEHMALDLTALGLKVEHIEIIDLGKSGSNSLTLDLNEALNITDSLSDDLVIKGSLGDQVTLANSDGGVWATVGQRTVQGQVYDVYHNSALASDNTLGDVLVQHNLQVHVA